MDHKHWSCQMSCRPAYPTPIPGVWEVDNLVSTGFGGSFRGRVGLRDADGEMVDVVSVCLVRRQPSACSKSCDSERRNNSDDVFACLLREAWNIPSNNNCMTRGTEQVFTCAFHTASITICVFLLHCTISSLCMAQGQQEHERRKLHGRFGTNAKARR